jgi:TFIIF-interacting CTD phosphatase-like protein
MGTKPFLTLDLDHTLIYAEKYQLPNYDFRYDPYYISLRPHLREVLSQLQKYFKIIIFSAGSPNYVKYITDFIFCKRSPEIINASGSGEKFNLDPPELILDISSCEKTHDENGTLASLTKPLDTVVELLNGLYSKNLDFEYTWNTDRILLVDNMASNFNKNPNNGILIPDYTGDVNDNVLTALRDYLIYLHDKDFVNVDKTNWIKNIKDASLLLEPEYVDMETD